MRNILIILIALCFFTSCKKLEQDKNNPDLPAYSEEGTNTGGCLINDTAWLNIKQNPNGWLIYPVEITSYPNGDSLLILFRGYSKAPASYKNTAFEIFIVLKNIKIVAEDDIIKLNDKTFLLDGVTNYGGFLDSSGKIKIGKAIGQIQFGKVEQRKNWLVGNSHVYIFAGHYNMSFYAGRSFSLTKGRFDYDLYRPDSTFIVF